MRQASENNQPVILHASLNPALILEYAPPPIIDAVTLPALPENWIALLDDIVRCHSPKLQKYAKDHVGKKSTYSSKQSLIESLKIIFHRLNGELDTQLGVLSENQRALILSKLTEGINHCSQGFHDRANEIILSMTKPTSFKMLLHSVRENLVNEVATGLTDEVHASNTVTLVAYAQGWGVRYRSNEDPYYGSLTKSIIIDNLAEKFKQFFTPFQIPALICDQLRGLMLEIGYVGCKTGSISSDLNDKGDEVSYDLNEIKKIKALMRDVLQIQSIPDLFIMEMDANEITEYVRDVNWQGIRSAIFKKLIEEGYFTDHPKPITLIDYATGIVDLNDETFPKILEEFFQNKDSAVASLIYLYHQYPDFCTALFAHPLFSNFLMQAKYVNALLKKLPASGRQSLIQNMTFSQFIDCVGPELFPEEMRLITMSLKCNRETLPDLIRGLSEKRTAGILAGRNGFYIMMTAMNNAAVKNNTAAVSSITGLLMQLISKCDAKTLPDLIRGLSENRTAGDKAGANGFYFMMTALFHAAEKNNPAAVSSITGLLVQLISQCDAETLPDLIRGLSENRTAADWAGTNGFYAMMAELSNAVVKNNTAAISSITDILIKLISRCDAETLPDLIRALSEKRTAGGYAGTNGFYIMMDALNKAAIENNSAAISSITDILIKLISQCDAKTLPDLIRGLSENRTAGDWAGANGFYWMMAALHNAAEKNNPAAVSSITDMFMLMMKKCDEVTVATLLENKTLKKQVSTKIFDFIVKNQSDTILFRNINTPQCKGMLSAALRDYIKAIAKDKSAAELDAICDPQTPLGQLIDCHQDESKQGKVPTRTRVCVSELCAPKVTSNTASFFNRLFNKNEKVSSVEINLPVLTSDAVANIL